MTDFLTDAIEAAHNASVALRAALAEADPTQALLLLPLIGRAVKLENETRALLGAIEAGAKS